MVEIESDLLRVISAFNGSIPDDQLDEMRNLAVAGEYGVAFENLCTQLFEFDVSVPSLIAEAMEKLGTTMKIDREYWEQLAVEEAD